ncbi:hypothetical protein [Agromyces sp. GXS1127]|uniref:hypothetical protein n=1 Tax=Agromyces sp. GXS1127 TaxID=3424181 RepID=UPI003D3238AE
MTRPAPFAPHLVGSAFLVRDREFHASTRSRLRAADVQRPFTAVRSLGLDLDDIVDRCRAYEPLLRTGEAFSHETAAALFRLPLPRTPELIHVLAPTGSVRARGRGVAGHVASVAPPVVAREGLTVVAAAVVWCQLAASLARDDLVALGDAIVTPRRRGEVRGSALASLRELRAAARAWGSRRGARLIAEALPLIRVGAESRRESHLRLVFVDEGLPEPTPNPGVTLAADTVVHPDLADLERRIAFEYLGDIHRTDRRRWQADLRRRRALAAAGWRVVEVTADDLGSKRAAFVAQLRGLLRGAA